MITFSEFVLAIARRNPLMVAAILSTVGSGCGGTGETLSGSLQNPEDLGEDQAAISVSGMKNYCSQTWPGGSWSLRMGGSDPCSADSGGTIQRKGFYSATGWNHAVARCYPPNYGWAVYYGGFGDGPLTAAFNDAVKQGNASCIFNATPAELPIFGAPYDLSLPLAFREPKGFDLARTRTFNVADFGQVGSATASVVNWKGKDSSQFGDLSWADGHDGWDWGVPQDTTIIKAVADGTVVMSRAWFATGAPTDPWQEEVAILHTVCSSGSYCEKFISYYAHFVRGTRNVSVGQFVFARRSAGDRRNDRSVELGAPALRRHARDEHRVESLRPCDLLRGQRA
jgi:hypothetical protein